MPYRLDRCLIDLVSKISNKENIKSLCQEALEIRSSAHQQVPVGGSKVAVDGYFES